MGPGHDYARILIELGGVAVLLAVLARLATRWGVSSISLFLLGGLMFGKGGLVRLNLSKGFIELGAELGVLLLLFMLGLEYSGDELNRNLRGGLSGAAIDLVLNFPPGLIAGLLLGWGWLPAVLLGGITFISSSGIIARVIPELGLTNAPETPTVLSILVLEDLIMAVYLPLIAVLLVGGGLEKIAVSVGIAVATVLVMLFLATHYGRKFSTFVEHQSQEVVLLTVFGIVLLVAGLAERLQVSAAIGAFLVGIALSGPIADQSHNLVGPSRDLFAATFFFFFGLDVNPRDLKDVLWIALILAVVTTLTKILTGYLATWKTKMDARARLRAGLVLVARGEFSIVIAGLALTLQPRLRSLAIAYVLIMAIAGPILARLVRPSRSALPNGNGSEPAALPAQRQQ